jgi:uncharacterized small protein (DUF1192 family)
LSVASTNSLGLDVLQKLLKPASHFLVVIAETQHRPGSCTTVLMSVAQANDTINMLEAEVDDLQAELAATQAVAAKHQRTAAASGQEIKVLQRLSSSGDISFMRTQSQTGRRSTTGHRHSEQGIPNFGSHDDLIHLQVCALSSGFFLGRIVISLDLLHIAALLPASQGT